jgi:predicted dehydrogenase
MSTSSPPFEPVGYGLVGFGRFCRNRLNPAFQDLPGSKITALYKRDPQQAAEAASEFHVPAGYGDLKALLADPRVEAVYITSANSDHEAQAVAAAKAGKHVLCEKPLAINAPACRNIIEACRLSGVKLMVAHTLRFSPAVIQVKQWLSEGRLGKIRLGRVLYTYDGTKSPRAWLYDEKIAGGGALMDIGIHGLDTLRFLLGEVDQVHGALNPPSDPIELSALVHLHFTGGAAGDVFCSFESPYRSRLEILGEYGWIWVDSFTLPGTDVTVHLETIDRSIDLLVDTGNPYGALIESFSRSIRGLEPVAIPGEEGLQNQIIIDELYAQKSLAG